MPSDETTFLTCFNRGCGKKFDPSSNLEDSCQFHPGLPFFHDAYKGWSCCNKKCIDFTEFLNIPGCTVSKHSNDKPAEPAKPVKQDTVNEPVTAKPITIALERPSFDMPMISMKPILTSSVKQPKSDRQNNTSDAIEQIDDTVITMGTICKNGGCNKSYEGPLTDSVACIYHPGCPIFHEGLKYWSCCQKRTCDFTAFLNQEGCTNGTHLWHKQDNRESIECRWDWHQTGNDVVISVYAKQYCLTNSIIKLNPVRVYIKLVFPQQSNSTFNLDLETRGIINVEQSEVSMFGTKVEVKLRKVEPGKWDKLDVPHKKPSVNDFPDDQAKEDSVLPQVDAIDLDDL